MKTSSTEPTTTNLAWKSHLANWKTYAAATGASLAMATCADASIISGTLDVTVSISPASNTPGSNRHTFIIAGAKEDVGVQYSPAHFSSLGPNPGLGNHFSTTSSTVQGHNSPRQGRALLASHSGGRRLSFFDTAAFGGFYADAKKLTPGAAIPTGLPTRHTAILRSIYNPPQARGSFDNSSGFVGFKTSGGDLGWLKVVVSDRNGDGYPDQVEVVNYAYNNVPGAAIAVGQTSLSGSSGSSSTPEPGTAALGLLAAGAAGITALRRRRKSPLAQ